MAAMPGDLLQQATDASSSDPMGEVETGADDDGKPPVYRVKADFQYDGALGISWVPDPELEDRLSRLSRKILRHRTNQNCKSG